MTRNLNNTDRALRTLLGIVLVGTAAWAGFTSLAGIVLLVLAAVMLGTAAVAVCPLYHALGVSTEPAPHRTRHRHMSAAQGS
jgi:hypothetical protein